MNSFMCKSVSLWKYLSTETNPYFVSDAQLRLFWGRSPENDVKWVRLVFCFLLGLGRSYFTIADSLTWLQTIFSSLETFDFGTWFLSNILGAGQIFADTFIQYTDVLLKALSKELVHF